MSGFFLDSGGVIHRHKRGNKSQAVIAAALVKKAITLHHTSVSAAHTGRKETLHPIHLKQWWPRMRQSIDE
jgi:hypothetical protein